jgi:hypothetical protein
MHMYTCVCVHLPIVASMDVHTCVFIPKDIPTFYFILFTHLLRFLYKLNKQFHVCKNVYIDNLLA